MNINEIKIKVYSKENIILIVKIYTACTNKNFQFRYIQRSKMFKHVCLLQRLARSHCKLSPLFVLQCSCINCTGSMSFCDSIHNKHFLKHCAASLGDTCTSFLCSAPLSSSSLHTLSLSESLRQWQQHELNKNIIIIIKFRNSAVLIKKISYNNPDCAHIICDPPQDFQNNGTWRHGRACDDMAC